MSQLVGNSPGDSVVALYIEYNIYTSLLFNANLYVGHGARVERPKSLSQISFTKGIHALA